MGRRYLRFGRSDRPAEPLVREVELPREGGEPDVVLIRRFSPADVLASGVIPQPLVKAVMGLASRKKSADAASIEKIASDQDLASIADMVNKVVCRVVLIPPDDLIEGRIELADVRPARCQLQFVEGVPDPSIPGQASIEDLDFADRLVIFTEVMKPDAAFRTVDNSARHAVDALPSAEANGVEAV